MRRTPQCLVLGIAGTAASRRWYERHVPPASRQPGVSVHVPELAYEESGSGDGLGT